MSTVHREQPDPRVSVIVPAFNAEATIAATIESVLAQSFDSFEVIVVNDGSTDGTSNVLSRYGRDITIVDQPNRGVSAARNRGARQAKGNFLAFLDSDDIWRTDALYKFAAALDHKVSAVLAFSDFSRVNLETLQAEPYIFSGAPSMEDLLRSRAQMLPSAVVIRSSVFNRCGGFCEQFQHPGFEDPLLWTIARESGEFIHVSELLLTYRLSEKGQSDWYISNGEIFIKLVRQRYGRKARHLISETYDHLARVALKKALRCLDNGDGAGTLLNLRCVLRLKPRLIFDPDLARRAFRIRNLSRLRSLRKRSDH